ncbi:helix-turn-helix domain-containing protein [Eubacteriales bacterium OttesenSCG-928-K08]|nr:helix-turn-helix domain-containing protein [Eubacteriales bacterium OttesenSCG-928-K08]
MEILERIKQLRDERGWSNYRLAKEAGISENSLNNLFRRNNLPTIPTLESICKGFGITLSQFFAESGEAVELSEAQREMLQTWNTLTDEQKNTLLEFLKKI